MIDPEALQHRRVQVVHSCGLQLDLSRLHRQHELQHHVHGVRGDHEQATLARTCRPIKSLPYV